MVDPNERVEASPAKFGFHELVWTLLALGWVLMWIEHVTHELGILPYLVLAACPLAHLFLEHRAEYHHEDKTHGET